MIRIKGEDIVIAIIIIPLLLVVYNFINNIITKPEGYKYSDGEEVFMAIGGLASLALLIVIIGIIVHYLGVLSKKEFKIKLK